MKPRAKERSRPVPGLVVLLAVALVLLFNDTGAHRGRLGLAPVLGRARVVPPGLLGFNGEAVTGGPAVWSDPAFVGAVARLRPEVLRVFGGAPANYWDWRAGTFVRASLLPPHVRAVRAQAHVALADWARIVRATAAVPVFDLNLLTGDLASQLAMLSAARRLGMPIAEVELGNELYLPQYAGRFPDGAAYGRTASRWIAALARAFPGVRAAADAFPGSDTNTGRIDDREREWNGGLLETLRGAAALSFHAYFRSGLADGATPASAPSARVMLSAPARRWAALSRVIAGLPPGLEAWVTEWSLFDTRARVHGTWAQALAVAAFGLELITAPRVTQADYHALVNNDKFAALFDAGGRSGGAPGENPGSGRPVPSRFGLYPGGVAMQALLAALAGARSIQALSFGSDRSQQPAGAVFTGAPRGPSGVLVNGSASPVTVALPGPLLGLPYAESWAGPGAPVLGRLSLHARSGSTAATLRLEPFSLVRIGRPR